MPSSADQTAGADVDFDTEFAITNERMRFATHARNAVMMSALADADRGLSPTKWQAKGFPPWIANHIDVIHDGVDTQAVAPNPKAFITLGTVASRCGQRGGGHLRQSQSGALSRLPYLHACVAAHPGGETEGQDRAGRP
jgi:hypothetical protein